ncbi:6-pyruvoyl-tetrahydropterin synthase-related protein [Periweissella fabalis]|uniref:Membrane protein 6-pyruvoyl-tetrahydropterin synthase-related domain-containing protein n=1 Tax=Periweissella fabalis TaxID=1070421 RepID=A0A7X6N3P5_9LACO|nr:6-pyruvoyl-tetrahydropterin synthase-related protein [Periweissella fabalis]MCM0598149.1 hypothetical protein [Periweissella fabalis]NKZ24727.1 hypothetical protein [Periweissella fabalis]
MRLRILKFTSIVLFFLLVSIVNTAIIYHPGEVLTGIDSLFNFSRIFEINNALVNGNNIFNLYSFSTFGNIGSAVQKFYPNYVLTIFSFIYMFTHNFVATYYGGITILTFFGMLIAYFCYKQFKNNENESILFSLVYILSTYHIFKLIFSFDISEWTAMLFLPILFLGVYQIMGKNKWQGTFVTGLGMGLVLATHILTALISSLILGIIWLGFLIINRKNLVGKSIKLLMSIVLVLGLNLPFLVTYMHLKTYINTPEIADLGSRAANYSEIINNSLSNTIAVSSSFGIFFIIAIIYSIIRFKSFTDVDKVILALMMITSVLSSKLFPWSALNNTQLVLIQYLSRFIGVGSIFMALIIAKMAAEIIGNDLRSHLKLGFSIIIIIGLQLSAAYNQQYAAYQSAKTVPTKMQQSTQWLVKHNIAGLDNNIVVNNINATKIINYLNLTVNSLDYWPALSVPFKASIFEQQIWTDKNNHVRYITQPEQRNNEILARIKSDNKTASVDLPILNYKKQYNLFVNNKKTEYHLSQRGTIEFQINQKDTAIKLIPKDTVKFNILNLLSFICLMITVVGMWFMSKKKFKKCVCDTTKI